MTTTGEPQKTTEGTDHAERFLRAAAALLGAARALDEAADDLDESSIECEACGRQHYLAFEEFLLARDIRTVAETTRRRALRLEGASDVGRLERA